MEIFSAILTIVNLIILICLSNGILIKWNSSELKWIEVRDQLLQNILERARSSSEFSTKEHFLAEKSPMIITFEPEGDEMKVIYAVSGEDGSRYCLLSDEEFEAIPNKHSIIYGHEGKYK